MVARRNVVTRHAELPLIVNGYSNIAIAFGVLALHLLDTNISRRVWFGLIAYQVSVLALAVWLGAFAMSAAAYFILLFTVFAASRRWAGRRSCLSERFSLFWCCWASPG